MIKQSLDKKRLIFICDSCGSVASDIDISYARNFDIQDYKDVKIEVLCSKCNKEKG